jgi:hypothetical protein
MSLLSIWQRRGKEGFPSFARLAQPGWPLERDNRALWRVLCGAFRFSGFSGLLCRIDIFRVPVVT